MNYSMKSNIENKAEFIEQVEQKYAELKASFQSLKERIKSIDGSTQLDVKRKYTKLEESLNSIGWKIEEFKNSPLYLDDTIKNSFSDSIAEIEWRIKEVEMSLQGKEVWDGVETGKCIFKKE